LKSVKKTNTAFLRVRNPDDEPAMTDLCKLVPVSLIRQTQNAFASALNIPIVFASPEGKPFAVPEAPGQFCWQLVRTGKPKSACVKCKRLEQLGSPDASEQSECPLGMKDIAVPLKSGDLLFGYLLTGQSPTAKAENSRSRKGVDSSLPTGLEQPISTLAELMTEAAVAARQNQLSAIHDPVTGLVNRSHFWNCLAKELERSDAHNYPVSLLLIDLDNFKQINSTFGHATGDRVLWLVGQVLRREVRASDLAARYGSDSFLVMLRCTDSTGADMVSWRLKSRIGLCKMTVSGQDVNISVSIGAVTYPDSAARDPDDLFKEAYESLLANSALPSLAKNQTAA
jgi:diguanylate cyclase (GGDEF)-like protein